MKTVRSWRELAEELMGWYDYEGFEGRKKLDAIERQHTSDDARLKAVVEAFLLGDHPSWRNVIHALHKTGETHLAEKIKTNAEPQQGEWVCTIPQYIHNTSHMTFHFHSCVLPFSCLCTWPGAWFINIMTLWLDLRHIAFVLTLITIQNNTRIDSDSILACH